MTPRLVLMVPAQLPMRVPQSLVRQRAIMVFTSRVVVCSLIMFTRKVRRSRTRFTFVPVLRRFAIFFANSKRLLRSVLGTMVNMSRAVIRFWNKFRKRRRLANSTRRARALRVVKITVLNLMIRLRVLLRRWKMMRILLRRNLMVLLFTIPFMWRTIIRRVLFMLLVVMNGLSWRLSIHSPPKFRVLTC